MDYKLYLFCLIAFVLGRITKGGIYVGPDEEKYKKAAFGLFTGQKEY